ncbi:MAG: cation diffusion facilitator family transporter [Dehalococcoidia bacterium]|jgi:cation diffusion facilitator family transporter
MDSQKQKTAVAALSVASNGTLVILKLISGVLSGSVAILSEAAHSSVDLIASFIALFAVRASAKRPDEEHPFGHGKIEDISALAEALLILAAAVWIIYQSIQKLLHPQSLQVLSWGIVVMLFSAVANIVISHLLFKVGKKTESPALIADGWHLRTDVYTSAGVFLGLGLIWAGTSLWPHINFFWIDPLAAMLVALLIMRTAFKLSEDAVKNLIDTSPPPEEQEWLSDYLESWYPTVRSIHRVRNRKSGASRFIDLHVVVDPTMSVIDSHEITEKMETDIKNKFNSADVTVHIEPCDGACRKICVSGCMMSDDARKSMQSKNSRTAKIA